MSEQKLSPAFDDNAAVFKQAKTRAPEPSHPATVKTEGFWSRFGSDVAAFWTALRLEY